MGNTLATDTMGPQTRKAYHLTSWIFTGILLISIIIYAGFRGHTAYTQVPTTSVNFQPMTSVAFPAFTFCPLDPLITLLPVACEIELRGSLVGSCMNTMSQLFLTIEGSSHSCLSFNSIASVALMSNGSVDEIGIQVKVQNTTLPAADPLAGAFVFVHNIGSTPMLLDGRSFIADVAKITEAFLRLDQISYLNNTKQNIYRVSTSSGSIIDKNQIFIMDIDFWFNPMGVYINKQYRPYTPNMWIGEVGGFACLFTFLHLAAVFIIMFIFKKVKQEPVSARFQDEKA